MPSKRGSKILDRVKSSKQRARSRAAAKPSASGTRRTRVAKRRSSLAPRTVVVGTLCVVAAAALVMSRQSSIVNWEAEVDAAGNVVSLERIEAPPLSRPPEPPARLVAASLRTTESEAAPTSPSSSSVHAAASRPATIAGCLERDDDSFWLRNVSGDDAPKSRSWKSGFLRKSSASVELVDGVSINRLASYVGRRIETTGALTDREMHVKTLRVLGACE